MKFRKISFILSMLMILFSGITAYAAECELGISLGEKGSDVELAVYKVADIQEGAYAWLPEYEDVDVDLTKVSSAAETKEAAEKIYGWVTEKNIEATQCGTTDAEGMVSFDVDTGVYVIAKKSEKGSMAPVLFMIQENQSEDHLILSPKFTDEGGPGPDGPGGPNGPDNPDQPDGPEDSDKPKGPTGVHTGDAANVILWAAVLVVALVGVVVIGRKTFRKK